MTAARQDVAAATGEGVPLDGGDGVGRTPADQVAEARRPTETATPTETTPTLTGADDAGRS